MAVAIERFKVALQPPGSAASGQPPAGAGERENKVFKRWPDRVVLLAISG